jgi:DNA-binding GntR family transcriptional regulator
MASNQQTFSERGKPDGLIVEDLVQLQRIVKAQPGPLMLAGSLLTEDVHTVGCQANSQLTFVGSKTLAERIFARLKHRLIIGQIAPGECLTVRALARQLGTSATPVRNALSQLAAADALRSGGQSGVAAPVLGSSELDELVDLRLAVEGLAFANAAPHYRAADRHAFKVLHADLRRVAEADCSAQFAAAVWPLRRAILGVTRPSALTMLVERLWCRLGPTFTSLLASVEQRRRISFLFGTIVAAIGRCDLEHARKVLGDEITAGIAPACGASQRSDPRFLPSINTAPHEYPTYLECGSSHD